MSATDAVIQKKLLGSETTALIISNKEMEDMKIVKSLEESWLLIKRISETIINEAKEQKSRFIPMLLGTVAAIRKCIMRTRSNKTRWRNNYSLSKFLMPPHPVTNFEIQKYQNKAKFIVVYSRNNLSKIKDGSCNKSWWVWINRNSLDSVICEYIYNICNIFWQLWSWTYFKIN